MLQRLIEVWQDAHGVLPDRPVAPTEGYEFEDFVTAVLRAVEPAPMGVDHAIRQALELHGDNSSETDDLSPS